MSTEKSIWSKLFHKKSTSSSNYNDFINIMESDYGIKISSTAITVEDLIKKGFHKITSVEATAAATSIFQHIPQEVATVQNNKAFKTAFDSAVKGSLWAVIPNNGHLGSSRTTPGAFKGTVFDNTTNKMIDNADFIPNTSELNLTNTAQIALKVFSAASFITGQYFMTQINGKLKNIQSGVDRIEQYLEDSRRSDLSAACRLLDELMQRVDYAEIQFVVSKIDNITVPIEGYIDYYRTQIQSIFPQLRKTKKTEEIEVNIKQLLLYAQEYRYAVQIIATAKVIELKALNKDDISQAELYRKEIDSRIHHCKELCIECEKEIEDVINSNPSLNRNSIIQSLAVFGGVVADALVQRLSTSKRGLPITEFINNKFEEHREKQKLQISEISDNLGNFTELEIPLIAVDKYIELLNTPIEIVQVDGEYYTNATAQTL